MAVWAALIGAAVSYYGAQQQKKNAKKLSKTQKDLYGVQADTARQLQPYALDYYKRSQEAFDPAMAYYKALASGDRYRTLAALSPQLSQIGNKYQSILQASRALNPRSGAGAAYNMDQVYRAGDEQQGLINQERNNAYANLFGMAGTAGQLGAGAAGIALPAAQGASSMANQQYLMNQQSSLQQQQAYAQIGQALVGMFGKDANSGWYIGNNPGKG